MTQERRQLAARVAGQADLQDIQVFRIEAELLSQPRAGEDMRYDLEQNIKWGQPADSVLVVEGSYSLNVWQQGPDDKVHDLATGAVTLGARYTLPESHSEFPDDEFEAFAETTGQFALYPFVRQQVFDLTGRIGLPPLVLGVLRIGLDEEELSEVDQP